jgi:hypothetical protein
MSWHAVGQSTPESGLVCWHRTTLRRLVASNSSPQRLTRRATEVGRLAWRLVSFELGVDSQSRLGCGWCLSATGASGQPHRSVTPGPCGRNGPTCPTPTVAAHRIQRSSALPKRTGSGSRLRPAQGAGRQWSAPWSSSAPTALCGATVEAGADWPRDAVMRLEACLRRCTVNRQELPPQMLEKVYQSGPAPPRVRTRPKHKDGRARVAVCIWQPAPHAVARNASDAKICSHIDTTILAA